MDEVTLKPNRTAFIPYTLAISTAFMLFIATGLIIASLFVPADAAVVRYVFWILAGLLVIGILINLIDRQVQFRKHTYILSKNRIVVRSGGLFSDRSTELELKNVTHVKLALPWLEHKLFRTGGIHIESAGSGGTEAHLSMIDEPERFYELVLTMLKGNGFSLKSEKNLYETQASRTGAIIDIVAGLGIAGFVLLSFAPALFGLMFVPGAALLLIPLGLIIVIPTYLSYRNAISKRYRITQDAIYYEEGFLTKRRAVIPAENLSDSHVNEPIHKRIFGIADVKVSCQGSGSEIIFSNIANAREFDATVDGLTAIEHEPVRNTEPADHKTRTTRASPERSGMQRGGVSNTHTYTPSMRYYFVSAGILAGSGLVLAFIVTAIAATTGIWALLAPLAFIPFMVIPLGIGYVFTMLKASRTTYTLAKGRVKSEADLFNKETRTFSDERLTSISVNRTLIDRIAKTVSVTFTSIGSGEWISFAAVSQDSDLLDVVKNAYGLRTPEASQYTPKAKTSTVLRSMIGSSIVAGVLSIILIPFAVLSPLIPIIGLTIIGGALIASVKLQQLTYRNAMLSLDDRFVYASHGWLGHYETWADVEDVKGYTITRYPFGHEGTVRFNIAGERVIKTKDGESVRSNYVDVPYLENVMDTADDLSRSIDRFAEPSPVRLETRINVARTVVPIIGASILLFFLAPILIPVAIIVGIRTSRITYAIEESRIIKHVRFLYETKTVLFGDRIDHISSSRGLLDRMFSTGKAEVNTTGSSKVELRIGPTKDHERVNEELRRAYTNT